MTPKLAVAENLAQFVALANHSKLSLQKIVSNVKNLLRVLLYFKAFVPSLTTEACVPSFIMMSNVPSFTTLACVFGRHDVTKLSKNQKSTIQYTI